MKEFIIFVCTDSTEVFFSKLRSAGLNYNLPSFFVDLLCGGYLISIADFFHFNQDEILPLFGSYHLYQEQRWGNCNL